MFIVDFVTQVLSILTLVGGIYILAILGSLIFSKNKRVISHRFKFITKSPLKWAFVVSLIATLGSLFYSQIAGYTPCELCWFQRIFMYPLVIILGVGLYSRSKSVGRYVIPLSIIGGIFSIYHYLIQVFEKLSTVCGVGETTCTAKYFFHFGYITFPMMALTAFALIIVFSVIHMEK